MFILHFQPFLAFRFFFKIFFQGVRTLGLPSFHQKIPPIPTLKGSRTNDEMIPPPICLPFVYFFLHHINSRQIMFGLLGKKIHFFLRKSKMRATRVTKSVLMKSLFCSKVPTVTHWKRPSKRRQWMMLYLEMISSEFLNLLSIYYSKN